MNDPLHPYCSNDMLRVKFRAYAEFLSRHNRTGPAGNSRLCLFSCTHVAFPLQGLQFAPKTDFALTFCLPYSDKHIGSFYKPSEIERRYQDLHSFPYSELLVNSFMQHYTVSHTVTALQAAPLAATTGSLSCSAFTEPLCRPGKQCQPEYHQPNPKGMHFAQGCQGCYICTALDCRSYM